jgi:hypothetical protein
MLTSVKRPHLLLNIVIFLNRKTMLGIFRLNINSVLLHEFINFPNILFTFKN